MLIYNLDMQPKPPYMWFGDFASIWEGKPERLFIYVGCVTGDPPADAWVLSCAHDVNVANEWIGHDPQSLWASGAEGYTAPPQSLTYFHLTHAFLQQMLPAVLFLPIKMDHPALAAECDSDRLRLMSRHIGEYLKRENHHRFDDWREAHTAVYGEVYEPQCP